VKGHNDYKPLQEALVFMKDLADYINTNKTDSDEANKVANVEERLINWSKVFLNKMFVIFPVQAIGPTRFKLDALVVLTILRAKVGERGDFNCQRQETKETQRVLVHRFSAVLSPEGQGKTES
jgi:hypothetical protein